jgi:hypothetical protein
MIKDMEQEFILGQTVIVMKESLVMEEELGLVF